jgi:hypothetical protein
MAENGNGNGVPLRLTINSAALLALGAALVAAWVTLNVQLTTAQNTATDAQKDAQALSQRVHDLEDETKRLSAAGVEQKSALTEVETQFRAADQARNQMHLTDLRYISLLWEHVYKERFPSDVFYFPTLSSEKEK